MKALGSVRWCTVYLRLKQSTSFFSVEPKEGIWDIATGSDLDFEIGFVVKGEDGISSISSPVGIAFGVAGSKFQTGNPLKDSVDGVIDREWLYSGRQSKYGPGWTD